MQDSERDRLTVEVCEAVSAISPAGSHLATTAARLRKLVGKEVPAGDDGKRVLREVFAMCEDTEAKCYEEPGDFARGRQFEAKGIARAIGAWYQEEFCGRTHMGEPAAPAPDYFRDATKMVPAPASAEVPMPEPVAYGIGNTAITGHTNRLMMVRIAVPLDDQYAGAHWLPLVLADEARTYGAACRAAGDAAGYARGLDACVAALVARRPESGVNADGSTWLRRIGKDDCIEAVAALRGEVKP